MHDELKKVLGENTREYYRNALQAEERRQYNTAVTLFFKALSSLCDLYILTREGTMPSSHSERFRILRARYRDVYNLLDKDFPYYQDSYRARLDKEISDMLKDDAKKLCEKLGLRL